MVVVVVIVVVVDCAVVVGAIVSGTSVMALSAGKLGKSRPLTLMSATTALTAPVDPCMYKVIESGAASMHSTLPKDESESVHSSKNLAFSGPMMSSISPSRMIAIVVSVVIVELVVAISSVVVIVEVDSGFLVLLVDSSVVELAVAIVVSMFV